MITVLTFSCQKCDFKKDFSHTIPKQCAKLVGAFLAEETIIVRPANRDWVFPAWICCESFGGG